MLPSHSVITSYSIHYTKLYDYAENAFDKAVLQFEEVVQQYGDNPKVAAALYKQALAFDALKDRASAKLVLKKLGERFPASEEAKKGKEKLAEWK